MIRRSAVKSKNEAFCRREPGDRSPLAWSLTTGQSSGMMRLWRQIPGCYLTLRCAPLVGYPQD